MNDQRINLLHTRFTLATGAAHFTAGQRLEGLTDAQLNRMWEKVRLFPLSHFTVAPPRVFPSPRPT